MERVITAIVLNSLLNELLPRYNGWKSEYIAGNNLGLQTQTRKTQNEIVEEFRKGKVYQCPITSTINCLICFFCFSGVKDNTTWVMKQVNIVVATSILEEGLDVPNCNLVVRFDPSATVSSFIQSRGRARMRNSDYLLMVKR